MDENWVGKKYLLIVPYSEWPEVGWALYERYYREYEMMGGEPIDKDWAKELYDMADKEQYIAMLGKALGMVSKCDGVVVANSCVNDRFTTDVVTAAEAAGFRVMKL